MRYITSFGKFTQCRNAMSSSSSISWNNLSEKLVQEAENESTLFWPYFGGIISEKVQVITFLDKVGIFRIRLRM